MNKWLRLCVVIGLAWFLGACTSIAPPYTASVTNVDVTAKLGGTMSVGKFDFEKGRDSELNNIGARASTFESPIDKSYAAYFSDAATKELKAAGKYDAAARNVLTGTLIKNHLSAAGMQTNESAIEVRFTLAQGNNTLFSKIVQASNEWESSFMGAIAIPRALDNYIATIQKLLFNLFSDPEFVSASARK